MLVACVGLVAPQPGAQYSFALDSARTAICGGWAPLIHFQRGRSQSSWRHWMDSARLRSQGPLADSLRPRHSAALHALCVTRGHACSTRACCIALNPKAVARQGRCSLLDVLVVEVPVMLGLQMTSAAIPSGTKNAALLGSDICRDGPNLQCST